MSFLTRVMRAIHFFFGITTPDKEHEKTVVFVWLGIIVAVIALGVGFTLFIVPYVMR